MQVLVSFPLNINYIYINKIGKIHFYGLGKRVLLRNDYPNKVKFCLKNGSNMAAFLPFNFFNSSFANIVGSCSIVQRASRQLLEYKRHGYVASCRQCSSLSLESTNPSSKTKKKGLSTNVIYVGNTEVSEGRAKVKRLKASQLHKVDQQSLSQFSTSSSGSLDCDKELVAPVYGSEKELSSDYKELSSDYKGETVPFDCESDLVPDNFSPVDNCEAVTEDEFFPIPEEPECSTTSRKCKDAVDTKAVKSKKPKSLSKKEWAVKIYEEERLKGRTQNFNDTLSAFISVCTSTGYERAACQIFTSFMESQSRGPTKSRKVLKIIAYNEILKGLGTMGDYLGMQQILKQLWMSNLKPTVDTFGHILACLGQQPNYPQTLTEIEKVLRKMDASGVALTDVISYAVFSGHSLQNCIKAIHLVRPNFKNEATIFNPSLATISQIVSYANPLVNSLNESLFSRKVEYPAQGVLSLSEMETLMEKQFDQEMSGYIQIPSILKARPNQNHIRNAQLLKEWEEHWLESLRSSLALRRDFMEKNFFKRDTIGFDFYPYFASLDNEEILSILMMEVHRLCMSSDHYSPSLTALAARLGNDFYNRFLIKYKENTGFMESFRELYRRYCHWFLDRSDSDCSHIPRVQWTKFIINGLDKNNMCDRPPLWPWTVKAAIGKVLYSLIISNVAVWNSSHGKKKTLPAFYKVQRFYDLKVRYEIKPSPLLIKVFRGAPQRNLTFSSSMLPMVSPPVPWTSIHSGGYVVSRSDFFRIGNHAQQQIIRMKEAGNRKLFPIMDSLNQLGSIPWKINTDVLDIIIEVFRSNGWEKMEIAPHPSQLPKPPPISASMSSTENQLRKKALSEYRKKQMEMYSLWCSMLYMLSISHYYRDQIIWLPLNMDFRGRTYTIPPHLTHYSSDVYRSIMHFAQGKKLGKDGIGWLKLHLINLTGSKKRSSIQERLDYCERELDEILDSADSPMEGRMWWTKSDEPWQTLAACKELAAALRSDDPEEFVSHLPIHQDGSCNGLQHYTALGRDEKGAQSVNLTSSIVPQDVYSDVAALVEEARRKDAESGVQIASVLEGFVSRKVIKQTVMTTVYGVTRYGAKLQILKQLNYLDDFPTEHRSKAASYLTAKTFESLGAIFIATKEIQNWLVKLAEGISKECQQNVEWVTPLGFPVVQHYSKSGSPVVVPGKVDSNFDCDYFLRPNVSKQKNGFPPNFIHSLDSTHMMLTSLMCQDAGITFVSVHDCFWTHASSVGTMNKICREQFVNLHSSTVLEDLCQFISDKYSSHMNFTKHYTVSVKGNTKSLVSLGGLIKEMPGKGQFDLKEVLNSVFFFS